MVGCPSEGAAPTFAVRRAAYTYRMDASLRRLERLVATGDLEAAARLRWLERRANPRRWIELAAHLGDADAREDLGEDAPEAFEAIYLREAEEDGHENAVLRWLTTRTGVYTKRPALRLWGERLVPWGDEICRRVAVAALRQGLRAVESDLPTRTVESFMRERWCLEDRGRDRLADDVWSRSLADLPGEAIVELDAAVAAEGSPALEACQRLLLVAGPGLCFEAYSSDLVFAVEHCVEVFSGSLQSVGMVVATSFVLTGEGVFQRGARPFLDAICAEVLPWARE